MMGGFTEDSIYLSSFAIISSSPLLGALSSGAFLLTCFISTGVISSNDKLGPGSMGMT